MTKEKKRGEVTRRKVQHYRDNREELIRDVYTSLGNAKTPAREGLVVLAPIFVLLYIISWLLNLTEQIPILGGMEIFELAVLNQVTKIVILLLFATIAVGAAGRLVMTKPGFRLEKIMDDFISRIPFLGTVYNITKVTADTVFKGAEDLNKPVKLDFSGLRVTGFKTGNTTEDGRDIIFLPTAPNVTTGLVIEAEKEWLEEDQEAPKDALTRIFSAGFGANDDKSNKKEVKRQVTEEEKEFREENDEN